MRGAWVSRGLGVLLFAGACNVAEALAAGEDDAAEAGSAVTTADTERFVGSYRFAGGQAQRTALKVAIEDLVASLNALLQGVAREKITETNPVFETVEIARTDGGLALTLGSLKNVCSLDGSATKVKGIDGSALTCRLSMKGDALVQRLHGPRGGRVNTFTVGKDGKLKMQTRIHSKMMPKDLRYTLTYAKK